MFCNKCGAALSDGNAFCSACGAPVSPAPAPVQPAPASNDFFRQPNSLDLSGSNSVSQQPAPAPAPSPAPAQPVAAPVPPVAPVPPPVPDYAQPLPVIDQPVPGYGQPVQPVVVAEPVPGKRSVVFAILGFIFGILSVSLCWIPILVFIPFGLILAIVLILFLLGLVFSIIGMVKKNGGVKGLAITGLILSILGILLSVIFMGSILGMASYLNKAKAASSSIQSHNSSISIVNSKIEAAMS